ncbi:hypothetical protein ASE16_14010 [Leifsonia sp. Root227]|uniref:hypothetical protein n=1 Tax=unclassified Leifsonia TaxID=2663824 RepID=UPI0006F6A8B4|nr:hypothetical protein [Leifsonia sp. Root227]KRC49794.1 hypothetical protein ASE16_14010 [Leifsonia sp. Root227]
MSATTPDAVARRRAVPFRFVGVTALISSIIAAACGPGVLGLAALLYAPIARATTISACEGPSLTPAQEHVSQLVLDLKGWAVVGALAFGALAVLVGYVAVVLNLGRALGVVALAIVLLSAVTVWLVWAFGFPMDPAVWHLPCGGG